MPASGYKGVLSSLFSSAIKSPKSSTLIEDAPLKHLVSNLGDVSSPAASVSQFISKRSKKSRPKTTHRQTANGSSLPALTISVASDFEHSTSIPEQIRNTLFGHKSADEHGIDDDKSALNSLSIPWAVNLLNNKPVKVRKEVSRMRKNKWVFKSQQVGRFSKIIQLSAEKLGTRSTIVLLDNLGRQNTLKEYNSLIELCINEARSTDDKDLALDHILNVFKLFETIREQGFPMKEETYGQLFKYYIDMGMAEEFRLFYEVISCENPSSVPRLGYYEMLLWIRLDDEEKIQGLFDYIFVVDGTDKFDLKENYLLALAESNRKKELLQLLETIDITLISSPSNLASIFKSLGRLSLESFAEKFLLDLKNHDSYAEDKAEDISDFIFSYAISIPNLAVEDAILKFKNLHSELDLSPSPASYEKIITCCCDSLKVHVALDVVDQMCEEGLTLSECNQLNSILRACEESYEFNLVRRIYSLIRRHNLKADGETFRSMISLSVKMKDFDGAYSLLGDLNKMGQKPTANMYNAIMAGYFREKNIDGGRMVFKQMEAANVKPDAQTISYLLMNCKREKDIIKLYGDLKRYDIKVTKHIFMALINAYAAFGQFEKAKEVVSDERIPSQSLNEVKSVLVSALASHGKMSDALNVYEEMKKAGCSIEAKAVVSLIEHLQTEGHLSTLLQLLEDLNDATFWVDACCRVILYCARHKLLRSAVDLLNQLKENFCTDEIVMDVLFDEVFSLIVDLGPTHLQMGLDLLQVIKDEFGLSPSRKSLDFLLSACINAKDLPNCNMIWREYQKAGLPYNVLSYVRMYQAFLACEDHKSAKSILKQIPQDDPHVRCVIKSSQTYFDSLSIQKTKTKKQKLKKEKNNEICD